MLLNVVILGLAVVGGYTVYKKYLADSIAKLFAKITVASAVDTSVKTDDTTKGA